MYSAIECDKTTCPGQFWGEPMARRSIQCQGFYQLAGKHAVQIRPRSCVFGIPHTSEYQTGIQPTQPPLDQRYMGCFRGSKPWGKSFLLAARKETVDRTARFQREKQRPRSFTSLFIQHTECCVQRSKYPAAVRTF